MFKFDFTRENLKRIVSNPFQLIDEIILQHFYRIPAVVVNRYLGIGTNVFSRNWDLLIILDSCRIDALQELADEYDFLDNVDSIKSVGGSTPEWMSKTFEGKYLDEIRETMYLTATGQLKGILAERLPANRGLFESHLSYKILQIFEPIDITELERAEYLFKYEPVGQEGPFGHRDGSTPPRYVTDRAIAVGREHRPARLIVHYIQPHAPYVAHAIQENRELHPHEKRPLRYLRETGDFEIVWETYLDEIRYVLDDVELLLDNYEAESVVITADHGDAFGEFGIYGHTIGSLHPMVRNVPWAETSARDSKSYTPTVEDPDVATSAHEESTEAFLEALGYKF